MIAIGQSLQRLNFYGNNISPKGGVAIGQSLQTNNTLLELWLNKNNLGPEGGEAICQSLQTNNTLLELDLENNNLGPDGAVAVIRGIAVSNKNTRITTLSIGENNITRLPVESAQCPPTLTNFFYHGNPIDYIPSNVHHWLTKSSNPSM